MTDRVYLPTFGELVDRLSVLLLKQIHIASMNTVSEQHLVMTDLHTILAANPHRIMAEQIRAIQVNMLANATIWMNESKARMGGRDQDKLLKFTHSINGVRSQAKNILNQFSGERVDPKVDCLAADLPEEFGNWRVF